MSFAINPLHIIFVLSALCFAVFWGWATWHAATTPNSSSSQKVFWAGSMLLNPLTAVWYWYIWKRWAFWLLFTPLLTTFATSPFIGKRLLAKSNAGSIEALFAFLTKPGAWLYLVGISIFVVFPLILRLVALVHLGKNKQVSALDRNDWIVALALPLFGFGAGIAYCAQHRRNWAIASLVWWMIFASLNLFFFVF
jgi:hypothetical protein